MSLPRHFVLYVGDPPTKFSVAALLRSGAAALPATKYEPRVGRPALIKVRELETPGEFSIEPLQAGLTGFVVQSFGPDGPKGQVEAFIDVRPQDGHTLVIDAGIPDEALRPKEEPQPQPEVQAGQQQHGAAMGGADKAANLRAKLIERYGLPADATDEQIQARIDAGMENAYAQGKDDGSKKNGQS